MKSLFTVRFSRKDILVPVVLLSIASVIIALLSRNYFLEDAWMHVRYATNSVIDGKWSVWNLGERPVAGDSSPLWLLLLIVGKWIGLTPYLTAKTLGSISWFLLGIEWISYSQKNLSTQEKKIFGEKFLLVILTFFWISLVPLTFYSVTGMETVTMLYILFRFFRVEKHGWQIAWSIPLVLIRPEGIAYVLLISFVKHFKTWKTALLIISPALGLYIAQLIFNKLYFGYPLPLPYYAKGQISLIEGLVYGSRTLFRFVADWYMLLVFALIILIEKKWSRSEWVAVIFSLFTVAYVLKVGGDNSSAFPYHRFLLPLLLFLVSYCFKGLMKISNGLRYPRLALIGLLITLSISHLTGELKSDAGPLCGSREIAKKLLNLPGVNQKQVEDTKQEKAEIIRQLPETVTLASCAAGYLPAQIPTYSVIDILGLNNPHIALNGKRQFGQVDTKSDMDWVIDQEPGAVILPIQSKYLQKGQFEPGVTHWRECVNQAIDSEYFMENYFLVPTDDTALFIHRNVFSELEEPLRMSGIPANELLE